MKVLAVFLCVAVSSALAAQNLGCWKDDGARVMVKSTMQSINDQTIDKCIVRCRGMGYPYAGLQWRRECFCGNDFTRLGKRPDSECNLKCTGDQNQICGGTWRVSVYTTAQYLGCWKDDGPRVMVKSTMQSINDQTINGCIVRCRNLKYAFAGLQWRRECFCGNDFTRLGKGLESDCNLKCTGNQQEVCGGNWRLSVYATEAEYLGCWRDDGQRVMERSTMQSIGNQSSNQCVSRCKTLGYPYAGTQYARECFCGRDFTRKGKAENCNMKCTGNSNENCGGSWALSVYKTGLPTPCELIGN